MKKQYRILITGAGGFVAPYVVEAIKNNINSNYEITATTVSGKEYIDGVGQSVAMNILDRSAVRSVIDRVNPTHFMHLAGVTAVGDAQNDPELAWQINLMGTLRCAEELKRHNPAGTFLFAGSSHAYGTPAHQDRPLVESDILNPNSVYGATKAAADLALGAMAQNGLKVIRFRPFNHTGPGQTEAFVVPGFAAQIARIEAGHLAPSIRVGNIEARRDFLDVRDVADAYAKAIVLADQIPSGTVFNLASGAGRKIQQLLDILVGQSRVPLTVEVDQNRWRPNDIPVLVGDASHARAVLGWLPQWPIETTLLQMLDWFRSREGELAKN